MSGSDILTLIVVLIILFYAFGGLKNGFVRTLMSMVFFIVAAAVVYFASPYVKDFLREKTGVYEVIEKKCQDVFDLEELLENSGLKENAAIVQKEQEQLIDNLPLPEILKKQLQKNNNSEGYALLDVSGFEEYVAGFMANLVLTVLAYVITFLLAVLILRGIMLMLDIVTALPVLKGLNRLMGFLLGSIQGIGVVWLLFLVLTVLGSSELGGKLLMMVSESPVLSFLYDNNIFLRILLGMSGGIV